MINDELINDRLEDEMMEYDTLMNESLEAGKCNIAS